MLNFKTISCAVLGNHDYRGNALAQLSPLLRKIDRRWFCQRSFILNAGIIIVASTFNFQHLKHHRLEYLPSNPLVMFLDLFFALFLFLPRSAKS